MGLQISPHDLNAYVDGVYSTPSQSGGGSTEIRLSEQKSITDSQDYRSDWPDPA